MTTKLDSTLSSSTGHDFSDSTHLDRHYVSSQPEYEAMLKSVGLQTGWHVLDAGCGSGSFHPLMSQLLGATGSIAALDLAPKNIEVVQSRAAAGLVECPIEAQVGPVTKLPYPDDAFDAIWCGAVAQYLSDEELTMTLSEFQRVARPGGLVALKDIDASNVILSPPGPRQMTRLYEAMIQDGDTRYLQLYRNIELPVWLRKAGFVHVCSTTNLVERFQPLPPATKELMQSALKAYYGRAKELDLSPEDLAVWEKLSQVNSPDSILNDPDFYFREGHILAIGQVPA